MITPEKASLSSSVTTHNIFKIRKTRQHMDLLIELSMLNAYFGGPIIRVPGLQSKYLIASYKRSYK